MASVNVNVKNEIAILSISNPPVNSINQIIREGIVKQIAKANAAPDVKAIILYCAGQTFMVGADIKEFSKPPVEPHLPDVVTAIERSEKPVIAAIHGQALGGGLEIALGAHYRIAKRGTKFGLPEVTLGLIPGASGTQRLPRLIGVEAAVDIIVSGKPIDTDKALELGLIDELSHSDLLQDAMNYTKKLIGVDFSSRRLSEQNVQSVTDDYFEKKRDELTLRKRGYEAPLACLNAIQAATNMPFDQGLKFERETFLKCRDSEQSTALKHLFFAERTSLKLADIPSDTPTLEIKKIAVIGAGTMGVGIAICFADAGFDVTLLEINPQALKVGLARIDKNYVDGVKRGRIDNQTKEQRLSLIQGTTDYDDLAEVDLVIEAAFEKMEVKQDIYSMLDKVCKKNCILATNTSYLDVNEIADISTNPQNILGMHFFSPANIMKLLEIVRADKTSDIVLKTVMNLSKKIGKIGVVSGVCHGFIGNRIYQAYQREVGLLLLEGASPLQIDNSLKQFGFSMGPCAVADLSGLDIAYFMRKSLNENQYEAKAFMVHNQLVEMNRKGRKSGAGFYDYSETSRGGEPSALVESIIVKTADQLNIRRRGVNDSEIVQRCIFAIINEAGHVIDEGIALRQEDIDVVLCNGYGFPRWRGGPMQYAQTIGWNEVISKINEYSQGYGSRWWAISKNILAKQS
uniref:3-hydroxyacyl-CoA dehydrogenase n=1 Tax=OCS116 cluster bacterium TaxID=2030921 RepID=A0A2A4Z0F6_9PROT